MEIDKAQSLDVYGYAENTPDYGIIDEGGSRNEWETSHALFFGWLWRGGFPLAPKQQFRGGDAFTAILASDSGSYTATGQITAVDRKKGTVRLKFTATNLSDWNAATHLIPRDRNPVFRDTYGAAVRENFTWEERWPLNSCMCWVE